MPKFASLILISILTLLAVAACSSEEPIAAVTTEAATEVVATETPKPTATNTAIPPTVAIADAEEIVDSAPPTLTSVPTITPLPTSTPTPTPEYTATPTVAPTWTPGPRPAARPPASGGYLSKYQLIAFYGSPWGRALGIMGNYPRKQMTEYIWGLVAQYQPLSSKHSMCAYNMVTTVANQNPPEYRHVVDEATLEVWIASAEIYECAVILDIQPGRMPIQEEFNRISRFLFNPHVHMAIDPEFDMNDEQIPGIQVGQTPAEDVNWVQGELQKISNQIGVNKVLMLHQFKPSMLPDKEKYIDYPGVEIVIDSDGTFNTDVKIKNYFTYMNEPGIDYGGIKHFFVYDDYLMTPEQTMDFPVNPSIVIYQ